MMLHTFKEWLSFDHQSKWLRIFALKYFLPPSPKKLWYGFGLLFQLIKLPQVIGSVEDVLICWH